MLAFQMRSLTPTRGRSFASLLTAGICAVAIVGCGSSDHQPTASAAAASFLPFTFCASITNI